MTADQIVAAVAKLQAERNELRDLLHTLVDSHAYMSGGDEVLIRVPAEKFAEIRAYLN